MKSKTIIIYQELRKWLQLSEGWGEIIEFYPLQPPLQKMPPTPLEFCKENYFQNMTDKLGGERGEMCYLILDFYILHFINIFLHREHSRR